MYRDSLPEPYRRWPDEPLTTGDVARGLQMSPEGVRYLVRDAQLRCRLTPKGWRIFQPADVARLDQQRLMARLAGKLPARQKLGPRGQPRQMSLPGTQLRVIGGHGRPPATLEQSQVSGADLRRNVAVSDKRCSVNQRAHR